MKSLFVGMVVLLGVVGLSSSTWAQNCTPSTEVCNGKDDDCNGIIDDGNGAYGAGGGATCKTKLKGACQSGRVYCTQGIKRDITVDASGNGDYTSIQAALNAASNGQTIYVKNGTYKEGSSPVKNHGVLLHFTKNVNVVGESVDGVKIVSALTGTYSRTAAILVSPGVVYNNLIRNFTITHIKAGTERGYPSCGGSPYAYTAFNVAGGYNKTQGTTIIRNVVFHLPTNHAKNLLYANSNRYATKFINITVDFGSKKGAVTYINYVSSGTEIRNSILYNTTGSSCCFGRACSGPRIAVSYSTFFAGTKPSGTGNDTSDPKFVNYGQQNYRLGTGSPAINTGDPAATYNDIDGTRNDKGAFGGGLPKTGFLECLPASKPTAEVCDGQDNDCDGQVDEGFKVGSTCSAGTGSCKRPGNVSCDGKGGTTCDAPPLATKELCNNKDDNCDGQVDEGFVLKQACKVGKGACENTGVTICKTDGTGTQCNAIPGQPKQETCDGKDNDCDGTIDNSFNIGTSCTVGKGECKTTGKLRCKTDQSGTECSATPKTANKELCDGKDNDCDGAIDNGYNLGQACTVGKGECKATGKLVCKSDNSGTQCDATPQASSKEVCDGKDNDCDGAIDNGYKLGDVCEVGKGECKATGKLICKTDGSGTQCDASPKTPDKEICDGKDNNCDGKIDDGFKVGDSCEVGKGECKTTGTYQCKQDGTDVTCDASPKAPGKEVCDGKDNDCDGAIDNQPGDTKPLEQACQTVCGGGIETCQEGGWKGCTAPTVCPEPSEEPGEEATPEEATQNEPTTDGSTGEESTSTDKEASPTETTILPEATKEVVAQNDTSDREKGNGSTNEAPSSDTVAPSGGCNCSTQPSPLPPVLFFLMLVVCLMVRRSRTHS